jgi:hypothetical protein
MTISVEICSMICCDLEKLLKGITFENFIEILVACRTVEPETYIGLENSCLLSASQCNPQKKSISAGV